MFRENFSPNALDALDVKRTCKDFWGKVALWNIVRQEM